MIGPTIAEAFFWYFSSALFLRHATAWRGAISVAVSIGGSSGARVTGRARRGRRAKSRGSSIAPAFAVARRRDASRDCHRPRVPLVPRRRPSFPHRFRRRGLLRGNRRDRGMDRNYHSRRGRGAARGGIHLPRCRADALIRRFGPAIGISGAALLFSILISVRTRSVIFSSSARCLVCSCTARHRCSRESRCMRRSTHPCC